ERDLVRSGQPPARPRMEGVRARQGARRQGADPWRHRFHHELHRAPRAGRRAHRPLRPAGGRRERHRRHGLRLRHLGRPVGGGPRHRLGQAGCARRGSPDRRTRVLPLRGFHVMRVLLTWLLLVALLIPAAPALAQAPASPAIAPDEKLPSDPELVTGQLVNGLHYIIRTHKNPEGRVSIWLHVSSGSLNETDSTRGLAHFLEHLAFNGSANFPPGAVVPFFQSLGLTFGRDQNAFTGFDQTTYQLALPAGTREVVEK